MPFPDPGHQHFISQVLSDATSTPVDLTGPTGPSGPSGPSGPTGPAAANHVVTGTTTPSGAPAAGVLPLYYDTTAITGGLFIWDGSAWVQVSTTF